MLIYNVTITIDNDIEQDWRTWMLEQHIPDVMMTGMFVSYRLNRLLNHEHQEAEIYTVQYLATDMEHLQRYLEEFAGPLQAAHKQRYEGKYATFRTVMELVDHNDKIS